MTALMMLAVALATAPAPAAVTASAAGVRTAGARPAGLTGTWDVDHVLVDGQDQPHWQYRPQDPIFLGRELVVDGDRVRFNGAPLDCAQTKWTAHATTWGQLLRKAFPRPTDGGRSPVPLPADFELDVAKTAPVTAYLVCPRAEDREDRFYEGTWLAFKNPNTLALRLDSSGLLLLTRRPDGARPTPSFPCAKASSPTEHAICGSFALAAWDRSVNLAWRGALERRPDLEEKTREEQKAFLRKRDGCVANAECLEKEMIQRVTDLNLR